MQVQTWPVTHIAPGLRREARGLKYSSLLGSSSSPHSQSFGLPLEHLIGHPTPMLKILWPKKPTPIVA
ncbi:unnamed protein product [Periconia digitata]|uniref:Uncharacterized protein n=1 Tax=Periconia digitata TaxID=1303443 RepID=A0A9W4UR44_9PLEO|nr:unnamed protein product [Periconia digitata]